MFGSLSEISFYIPLEKNFFEADLSCDRSYRFSNDRRANVQAMAAFKGMLLNFNI